MAITSPAKHPSSDRAKAELAAKLKPAIPDADRIKSKAALAAFRKQHPGPSRLFNIVLGKWRMSGAKAPSVPGEWAAWRYPEWAQWHKVSVATLERHLNTLEAAGLIERERHQFGGRVPLAYIRPTPEAMTLVRARPSDWWRLGITEAEANAQAPDPLDALMETYEAAYQASVGTPVVIWTDAEKAALRAIRKAIPAEAQAVVKATVGDWVGFTIHVAKAKGFSPSKTPMQPSPAYIYKHLQAAADFAAEHKPKETAQKLKPQPGKPHPEAAPVVGHGGKPIDQPQTYDEFMALLNEDG